jgi:orotate phosphoribosyltransferase
VKDWGVEVVCGPATGGLIVADWTAHALGALSVFTEHGAVSQGEALRGRFVLGRGYEELVRGKRVLVVDDIVNTGLSLRETAQAVCSAGGELAGAACLVSRGNVAAAGLGVERYLYLLEYKIPAWPGGGCPLCRSGVPVNTRYAHGSDFLARQIKRS